MKSDSEGDEEIENFLRGTTQTLQRVDLGRAANTSKKEAKNAASSQPSANARRLGLRSGSMYRWSRCRYL